MDVRKAVFWGTTGHARSIDEVARCTPVPVRTDVVAYIDDFIGDRAVTIDGRPVISFERWREAFIDLPVIVTSGYPSTRKALAARVKAAGGFCGALVDLALKATYGEGVVSGCLACISPSVVLGAFVHVYSHTTIGPHSHVGDFVTLAQGVVVGANVTIGSGSFVGCGATLAPRGRDGLRIGENAHIHAGTVIRDDVPDGAMLVGDPPFDPRLHARRNRRDSTVMSPTDRLR